MNGALFAAILVGGGLAMMVIGFLQRFYAQDQALAEILDLPYGEQDVPIELIAERHSALVERGIGIAGDLINQVDEGGKLLRRLELARVPMRPAEFVVLIGAASVIVGSFIGAVTQTPALGVIGIIVGPLAANSILNSRINKRRNKFQEMLPDCLMLISGSLTAGHTFLRAIQMMTEEAEEPMNEEFGRVVSETQLGDPVVEALDRMAKRLDLADVDFLVQAVRIQQTVGGRLADLLLTLAEFMRAREEIRREIKVLTAEGRISAWMLGGLPFLMALAISVMNPGYLDPLFMGGGWYITGGTIGAILGGVLMIKNMVDSIEV